MIGRSRRRDSGRPRWLLPLVVVALITVLVTLAVVRRRGGDATPLPPDVGVVTHVIDGDTVIVDIAGGEEHVRLIGVNTPETHVDNGPPECFGPEAADYTTSLLPVGTEVRLARDMVGRDDYGRLLAYVYRRDDDLFVNESLVASGYARVLTIPPNDTFADRFAAAAAVAERSDLGLWAACSG